MIDLSQDKIYIDYHDKIFSYIYARIKNHNDSEELTAEVFYKILSNKESYDESKAALSTWIYTITNNAIRDHIRCANTKSRRIYDADDEYLNNLISDDANNGDNLLYEQNLELLASALSQLSERERLIVILHYYDCITHKKIAEKLNLSHSNVRFINHKAILKLRAYFKANNII